MKIGIMGGTFDPIHDGHLLLAEHAYREMHLDEIWFLPNGNPPHKSKNHIGSSANHRVAMLERAIRDKKYFKLSMFEMEQEKVSYSYETMEHFKELFPDHQFYFIVGADSLFSIDYWKRPDRLLKMCTLLAAYRGEADTKEEMDVQIQKLNKKYGSDIKLLQMPLFSVSSSEIREKVKEGQVIEGLVPKEVADYIQLHNLFKGE